MSTTSEPHLACFHSGFDFDWWRCNTGGYVGRPPSPFPAAFEHPRLYREDSQDRTYGIRILAGSQLGDDNQCPGCAEQAMRNRNANQDDVDEAARKLYWPLCQGPEPEPFDDMGDMDLNDGLSNGGGQKTPRLPQKRPPWCPAKMPNKWGVAGHPPPYTNYCKETIFNTKTADPMKVTIKKTF